jgi:hypothetical protein
VPEFIAPGAKIKGNRQYCHSCKAWWALPEFDAHPCIYADQPIAPIDASFKVIPEGARNSPEALKRWQRYVNTRE